MPSDVGDSGQTIFQGFSLALFPDYIAIMEMLVRFPHDMLEVVLTKGQFVASKMVGSALCIRMLRVDLLNEEYAELSGLPTIIWSTDKSAAAVELLLDRFKVRPLHITCNSYAGAVPMKSLTTQAIYGHLLALVERTAAYYEEFQALVQLMKLHLPAMRNEGLLPFIPQMHNCTFPMAEVLHMYGYSFENQENIKPAPGIDAHIDAMVDFSEVIDRLREEQQTPYLRKNDAIVFCPSIYAMLYKVDNKIWNPILRNLNRDMRTLVKSILLRNKAYGNAPIDINGARLKDLNPYTDAVVGPLLKDRQLELRIFTIVVAVLAANQFVPAFRLPNAVMLHHDNLSEIYDLIHSNKPTRSAELNKRLADYGAEIRGEIGEKLWNAIFSGRKRLVTICDFPIEWLPIDGVPAMFRYEMSRIPSTPGNLMAQVALTHPRASVPKEALKHILVIRSFEASDPIRDHLMQAIRKFELGEMVIQIVDVSTKGELVAAMNAYRGALLIFDCHGNHGGKTEHGWLQIGKECVDVWDLRREVNTIPIVVLAACSTHPLDGSHASVANGFLAAGVQAVLGTFAPVDSAHTAILVARLIFRIATYLPLVTKSRPVSWREIVGTFFRMSYVSDVLRDLHHVCKKIDDVQFRLLSYDANMAINVGDSDWLRKMQQGIIDATGMSEAEIREIWASRYQFVETMLFAQLGRPENVIIESDDFC